MSVTVTLHLFSGVSDPSWELTDLQAQELADRIARINKTTMLKPAGIVGGLGRRGFSVNAVRERQPSPRAPDSAVKACTRHFRQAPSRATMRCSRYCKASVSNSTPRHGAVLCCGLRAFNRASRKRAAG